jgi:hypothetical protein
MPELEATRVTNTKSTGLTKNEVLKRWEISSLALSLALPSISLQIPHQISLGIKEGSKEGLLNAQWESAGELGQRENK